MAEYNVNKNNPNVSVTDNQDVQMNEKQWSIDNIYQYELTIESLINVLTVTDVLKRKYPNDEFVVGFEDIIRDEICQIFGGSILNEEY